MSRQHAADLVRLDRQHQDIGELHHCRVGRSRLRAGFLAKEARAVSLGSLAMTCLAVTSPARIKPLASAVAILPAPRKPMVSFADMPAL